MTTCISTVNDTSPSDRRTVSPSSKTKTSMFMEEGNSWAGDPLKIDGTSLGDKSSTNALFLASEQTSQVSIKLPDKRESGHIVITKIPKPPDGGWGWVVVLSCMLNYMLMDGIASSFGVMMAPLQSYLKEPPYKIALAHSLMESLIFFFGPLVAALIHQVGCRSVSIYGSICASVGFFVCGLGLMMVDSVVFIITFGVVIGIGFGCINLSNLVLVSHYFEKRRALAVGLSASGAGVGMFLFPQFINTVLMENYSLPGVFFLLAVIFLNSLAISGLLRPLEMSNYYVDTDVMEKCQQQQNVTAKLKTIEEVDEDTFEDDFYLADPFKREGEPRAKVVKENFEMSPMTRQDVFYGGNVDNMFVEVVEENDSDMLIRMVYAAKGRGMNEADNRSISIYKDPDVRSLSQYKSYDSVSKGKTVADPETRSIKSRRDSETGYPRRYFVVEKMKSQLSLRCQRHSMPTIDKNILENTKRIVVREDSVFMKEMINMLSTSVHQSGTLRKGEAASKTAVLAVLSGAASFSRPDVKFDDSSGNTTDPPKEGSYDPERKKETPVIPVVDMKSATEDKDVVLEVKPKEEVEKKKGILKVRRDSAIVLNTSQIATPKPDQSEVGFTKEGSVPLVEFDKRTSILVTKDPSEGLQNTELTSTPSLMIESPYPSTAGAVEAPPVGVNSLADSQLPQEEVQHNWWWFNREDLNQVAGMYPEEGYFLNPKFSQVSVNPSVENSGSGNSLPSDRIATAETDVLLKTTVTGPLIDPDLTLYDSNMLEQVSCVDHQDTMRHSGLRVFKFRRFCKTIYKMFNLSLLYHPPFLYFFIGNTLLMSSYFIPFVYLPQFASTQGLDQSMSGAILSIIGLLNTLGRIVFGYAVDTFHLNPLVLETSCISLFGLSMSSCLLCAHLFWPYMVVAAVIGITTAGAVSLTSISLVHLLGVEKLSESFGSLLVAWGVGATISSPIGGVILQLSNSYIGVFLFSSVCAVLSGLALLFSHLTHSKYLKDR